MKQEIKSLAKQIKASPNNNKIRENTCPAKRCFPSTMKRKKSAYKLGIINEMTIPDKTSRKGFWKLFGNLF